MKKIVTSAFAAVFIFSLSACSSAPTEDMETVIQKAWEKIAQQQAERQTSNLEVSGNLSIDVEGNKGQIEGKGNVQSDATDVKNPKFAANMELKGSGAVEGQSGKADLKGEIRVLNKKMFVNLENLNIDVGDAGTNMMANMIGGMYKGKWIELPADTMDTGETSALDVTTLKGKEIAEVAKIHRFIVGKKDLGNGTYEISIDVAKLKTYLTEVAKVTGTPIDQESLAAIDEVFKTLNYSVQVRISNEYDLEWVKGTMNVKDEVEQQELLVSFEGNIDGNDTDGTAQVEIKGAAPGKLNLSFQTRDQDDSVKIEEPVGAEKFDLGSLLGGGMGLGDESMMEGLPAGTMDGVPALPEGMDLEEMMKNMPQ